MYLAHQVMFLGPQYKPGMPPVLQGHITTFVDLVNTLRSLAASVFTKQIQMQKKHIIDILRDSGETQRFQCIEYGIEVFNLNKIFTLLVKLVFWFNVPLFHPI